MDNPQLLPLGSMQLDIASAFYAGKPEIASTAAALTRAPGPPPTLPRLQPPPQRAQSSLLLWPPVICPAAAAAKHPTPSPTLPPAKKLCVQRTSSVLTPALPALGALPVVKLPLPKLQVRPPLRQASPVLEQKSLKQEMTGMLPTPATSVNPMQSFQKLWTGAFSVSKDKALTRKKYCKCKNSKCLKLYCGYFANGRYCSDCSCGINCYNNGNHEKERQDAINVVLERRPTAFMRRSCAAQNCEGKAEEGTLVDRHSRGCNCQKSECLKNYCVCFQSNVLCSDKCTCMDCKNHESNEDRKEIPPIAQKHAFFGQNKNCTLSGMLGPASVFPLRTKINSTVSMSASRNHHPIINNMSSQTLLCFPTHLVEDIDTGSLVSERVTESRSNLGPHEVAYRSPLMDIIQVEDVNELCKHLVLASRQAAKAFLDSGINKEKTSRKKLDRAQSCLSSTSTYHDREAAEKEPDKQVCLPENSYGKDSARPLSPGSEALVCDEQGAVFQWSRAADTTQPDTTQNLSDIFVEQEKRVLTSFRDYLCKLARCGRLQEGTLSHMSTKCQDSINCCSVTRVGDQASRLG